MLVSVLSNAEAHTRALRELFEWADEVDMACAWATADEGRAAHWRLLNLEKIRRAVIGTEFAQTEPWVLRTLLDAKKLRVGQSKRTFHPKLYLGYKGQKVRALVGSANFTASAFSHNVELGVLLEGSVNDGPLKELAKFVNVQWKDGMQVNLQWLLDYEVVWNRRPTPPDIPHAKLHVESVDDLRMSWDRYYKLLVSQEGRESYMKVFKGEPSYTTELDRTQAVFRKESTFAKISPDDRRLLMGLPGASSGLIGSMGPARYAKRLVKDSPEEVGRYLDQIPLSGAVSLTLVDEVMQGLTALHGVKLGVATRLLAVKRPDLFVSVNNASNPKLSKLLGRNQLTTAKQYVGLLQSVWQLDWHLSPPPADPSQHIAWQRRAALLDCVLYEQI